MKIPTADGNVPALLLRLAAPGIPPALSLAAMIAGPVQMFAVATASIPLTLILAAAICFHFARQFSAQERDLHCMALFVGWTMLSVVFSLAVVAATLAATPLTPKPGWLEAG